MSRIYLGIEVEVSSFLLEITFHKDSLCYAAVAVFRCYKPQLLYLCVVVEFSIEHERATFEVAL